MHWFVKLELVVCDDFTGTVFLVGEDTILKSDDRIGGADGLSLLGDGFGDIVGSDLKGARVIFIAAIGGLRGDGGDESGEEGESGEGLHGDDILLRSKWILGWLL